MNVSIVAAAAWLGTVMVAGGSVVLVRHALTDPVSPSVRAWTRHVQQLDQALRFVRAPITAQQVGCAQVVLALWVLVTSAVIELPLLLALLPGLWAGPELALRHLRSLRVQQIEDQLDTWLLVVANGLKAVPSLGDAIASSVPLIGGPFAEELAVALQEHRLGSPLHVAVLAMATRVNSPVLRAAVTTLEVARRTGGALSQTLEQAAASLREMARLQGVVRTKTAESKSQAFIISFVPAILLLVFQQLCPELIEVLFTSRRGHVVLAIAALLWVGAIAGALRILRVDT